MSEPTPSKSVSPDKLGEIINQLMDHVPQKAIAFDKMISFRDVSLLRKAWPLFCGLDRYNGRQSDENNS